MPIHLYNVKYIVNNHYGPLHISYIQTVKSLEAVSSLFSSNFCRVELVLSYAGVHGVNNFRCFKMSRFGKENLRILKLISKIS